MIETQTHTAAWRVHDDRTAGHMPVYGDKKSAEASHFSSLVREASGADAADGEEKSARKFGFLDFIKTIIDIINPLQHIPVISTIYRHVTGDEINPVARIAGGALFGGPIGAAASVANVAVEGATGKDIGENMLSMVSPGHGKDKPQGTQLAAARPRHEDIIWDRPPAAVPASDENVQVAMLAPQRTRPSSEIPSSPGPAPTKPSYRMGLTGSATGFSGPSQTARQGVAERHAETAMRGRMNVKPPLLQQEAPAGRPENGPVPPELIASRMMAALDKYAALKAPQMNPARAATF